MDGHNCVESLQKLVQVQQDQIGNLEAELRRVADFFGQREQILFSQITALHGEIQRQAATFRKIVDDCARREPVSREVILEKFSSTVRKCKNGNIGFSFISAEKESRWPFGGVVVSEVSENINVDSNCLQKGDWILKVNGRDLSKASHGEAVEEFRRAKEPIVVEVLRRSSSMEPPPRQTSPVLCDGVTQTEWTGGWETPPTGLYPFVHGGFSSSSTYHQMALLGNDVINNYRPLMEADQDEDDGCDVEYEEVTLRRTGSTEKLGLTLCYGAPDEPDTDIFVSEIEADSVAAKDGRIQEGDQLLQINGIDVHNREQAVSLFAVRRSDFTLLLARPQMEEYLLNEHPDRNGTDLCQNHHALMEEDDLTTDTGTSQRHEKDSGVGRTDESTRNDESSEHELEDPPLKCASTSTSNLQSDASLDREMARLNQEMASIRLECESLVSRHHQRRSDRKQSVERWVQSNLTLELSPLSGDHRGSLMSLVSTAEKGTQLQESDVASIFSCESCRRCCRIQLRGNSDDCSERPKKRGNSPSSAKGKERNRNYVTFLPTATTMYTNQANLQHTILIQQQLFREALAASRSAHRRSPGSISCPSSPSKTLGTVKEEEEMRMEWKVKRRSDGSRYIARRPVRNRLLKERAIKITEERTGLTTDDDAISELKVGRYWSKEERKRHLERARDRKRKEMVLRAARLASAEECPDKPNIVELSQRKLMARHRGKAVFDDFTTVQEVLAHGNRISGPKTFGLLSVTTV